MLFEQTPVMIHLRMYKKQKLELTWIGKEHRPRLEPRILLEDTEKSYHAKYRVKEGKASTAENAKSTENSDSLRSLLAAHKAASPAGEIPAMVNNDEPFSHNQHGHPG